MMDDEAKNLKLLEKIDEIDGSINNISVNLSKVSSNLKQIQKRKKNAYYRDIPADYKSFIKRVIRKLIKPIVKPIADQQTQFNNNVAEVITALENIAELNKNILNEQRDILSEFVKPQMRIVQLLPNLSYGDAVGNEVIAIHKLLKKMGYVSDIYAEVIHNKLGDVCKDYERLPQLSENDILIYHFAIGWKPIEDILTNSKCKKVMIYHNITPSSFFVGINKVLEKVTTDGRKELGKVAPMFDYCIADSEYNAEEIRTLNVKYEVDVMPLLIPFGDYDQGMNIEVLERYADDGWINIIFVGRIAPNKKQEDVIRAFAYYKKNINNKSRLIFVGNYNGMEKYYKKLLLYVEMLDIEDVVFTGHIKFDEILAYYNLADVFVCMSEHEGFCVPLVEAMYFDIPIIAYKSSAIPYVLGDSGILIDEKNPVLTAKLIDKIVNDESFRKSIVIKQRERLRSFLYDQVSVMFENFMKKIL